LIHIEANRHDPISMIIVDLNDLKVTNDLFGHHIGDKLIRRAAEVMNASINDGHITARIGGDEFIIIMPNAELSLANEIIERIQSLVTMNNKYYREPELSLSLGASVSEPGLTLEKVISLADDEMYKNKGQFYRRRKEDVLKKP